MTGNFSCPHSFNCSGYGSPSLVSFDIGLSPSYVTIASSSLSCLGSLLILLAFCVLKDLRTGAQKIITLLAAADFVSAAGYILGSVNFIVHYDVENESQCSVFRVLCVIQAAVTSWSSLVSFCLSVILAFHFFLIIVYKQVQLAGKLLPVYNIIAWGGPLLIVVPLLATNKLGYAPYAASNWCFVRDMDYSAKLRDDGLTIAIILVAGKGWEFISYIAVTLLYILIIAHIGNIRRWLKDTQIEPRMLQVEWRLMAIPVLFVLLRMWGTIQFIFALSQPTYMPSGCIPSAVHTVFLVLGILQAIGDGGQGWGNAILYIVLSPTIRKRLFSSVCGVCIDAVETRFGGMFGTDTADHTRSRPVNPRPQQFNINRRERENSSTPLIPSKPATGYNVRKYDSTSSYSEEQEFYGTIQTINEPGTST